MKTCRKCESKKDLDDFPKKGKGRATICKSCNNEYFYKWYRNNKETHKKRVNKARRERRKNHHQFIMEYLSEHPCVDCGESDPLVLEFDHVRGKKEANISDLLRNASKVKLEREIKKCDIRCANCHRRRTLKEMKSTYRT